jgi:hypothetical protein
MTGPVGPPIEWIASLDSVDFEQFAQVIGALGDGAARFPSPFNVTDSALLGANVLVGSAAVALFEALRTRMGIKVRISISEVADHDVFPLERQLLDCLLAPVAAAHVLDELAAHLRGEDWDEADSACSH